MKILAGIVLYNPEIDRLRDNINAIIHQVDHLILIDNGSNSKEYISLITNKTQITVINNPVNLGIATALNEILHYGLNNDYNWVLTLDQDSVVSSDLIDVYRLIISANDNLGMVCCNICDRNANLMRDTLNQNDRDIDECITSASMVRVKAWQEIGGFDDAMFIDSVDFDFSKRLRYAGWRIFKTYKTSLLHEVGHSKVIKIFGKEYLSLNHSPFRYYYIIRNNIYMGRKHKCLLKNLLICGRQFYTVSIYEEQKWTKLKRMTKGLFDGFTMKITKSQPIYKTNNG